MVECALSDLPSDIIRSALHEAVENVLNSTKYSISISSASKAGENNFMGEVFRASFHEDDESEDRKRTIHKLIFKISPQLDSRRTQFNSRPLFLREIFMYDKVLPFFREFQESKGVILKEDGFIEYPKCLRCVDIEPSECVFLEDMSVRGFSIIDRYTEDVTFDHVRLVMESLAKFHAISFALKDQQPEKFKELSSELTELFVRREVPFMKEWYNKMMDNIFYIFSSEEDADLLSKLKKLRETDIVDIAYDCANMTHAESATVISHGDCWQNNIMFKYDTNKKPIEVSLLDWQVSRHSSPIIDIVYFLFICTTKELRDAHYDEFLWIYHNTLSTHIRRLGSDPDLLFPYKVMQEHFRKFGKFGLIMAVMLLPMITNESGNGLDLDELSVQIESGHEFEENPWLNEKTRAKFDKRMHGVVADMVRLDYI